MTDISEEVLDCVGLAIEKAGNPGREGPYGLYDYTTYGDPIPHHVRDFRDMRSDTYGHTVFRSTDRDLARAEFEKMTRHHIARAAIEAFTLSSRKGIMK